jgi:hypothetical protein
MVGLFLNGSSVSNKHKLGFVYCNFFLFCLEKFLFDFQNIFFFVDRRSVDRRFDS